MDLHKIKKMLEDLIFYYDCEITHTFSKSPIPFAVSIKKEKIQSHFLITYIESQYVELYPDVESAALAIAKLLNRNLEESTIK